MKLRKTTTWLRDWRERRGGGVPASGRSASLADFGTINLGGEARWPNSPVFGGVVFMSLSHAPLCSGPSRH
jgi:hypothetical protein